MNASLDIIDHIGSKHYFGALPAFRDVRHMDKLDYVAWCMPRLAQLPADFPARCSAGIGWTYLYQPMEAIRQNLETVLRIEGPATAKLQIDEGSPGAPSWQALDAKIEGGIYDALGLCVYQAKEDAEFHTDEIKVITNWPPPGWPE